MWGIWWAWDARLVTTAVLFFLYLGYLALRRVPAAPETRGEAVRDRRAGRVRRRPDRALLGHVVAHAPPAGHRVQRRSSSAHIHGVMAFTLWFGVFAFTLLFVYLLDRRYRLLALEEQREEREVEQAIAERIGTADPAVDPAGSSDAASGSGCIRMKFAEYVITGWVLTGVVIFVLLALDRAAHPARRAIAPRCRPGPRVTTTEAPPSPVPAPRRPRKLRTRYIVAIGGCVAAIVAIIVLAVVLSENVVYFRTVTEAVHARSSTGTSRFRIAGAVVPGTIHETKDRRAVPHHRRQAHRHRRPQRRSPRPVQGGRAGRV